MSPGEGRGRGPVRADILAYDWMASKSWVKVIPGTSTYSRLPLEPRSTGRKTGRDAWLATPARSGAGTTVMADESDVW